MEKEIIYVDKISDNISLEPAWPEYEGFLYRVFKESRPDLMYIADMEKEERDKIIYHQFLIEKQQVMSMYSSIEFKVIIYKEELIGRLYINYGKTSYHVIELGMLEKYRRMGIGRKVMTNVIEKAIEKGKSVTLQVAWYNNSAILFYKKLGFELVKNNGVFYEMKYEWN